MYIYVCTDDLHHPGPVKEGGREHGAQVCVCVCVCDFDGDKETPLMDENFAKVSHHQLFMSPRK